MFKDLKLHSVGTMARSEHRKTFYECMSEIFVSCNLSLLVKGICVCFDPDWHRAKQFVKKSQETEKLRQVRIVMIAIIQIYISTDARGNIENACIEKG